MGSAKTPSTPNPAKAYAQGVATNLAFAPVVAGAEQNLRQEYDGPSVEQTLDLRQQFVPQAIDQYRQQLAQNDPWSVKDTDAFAGNVSADLVKAYSLDGDQTRMAQQTDRAADVLTGNYLGNAAVSKEARALGAASFTAYQQRITNAENYLAVDNAVKQYTNTSALVSKVATPDRSDTYVQPAAGSSFQNLAAETYHEDLEYIQNYAANINDYLGPWQRMAQGAYIGLREGWQGGSYFGFMAGAYGAIGGALGGSFQGLINAPDYQWNVSLGQYDIYGNPNAGASAGQFGGSVAASGTLSALSNASTVGG